MREIKVIASSITNLTDARYFAAHIINALSFDLNIVDRDEYFAIKDWVEGIPILLETKEEFMDLDIHEADGIIYYVEGAIQEDAVMASSTIVSASMPILDQLNVSEGHILRQNWQLISNKEKHQILEFAVREECFLDIAPSPDELKDILENYPINGLVLRGGDEEKVGYKSFNELDEIFDLLDS